MLKRLYRNTMVRFAAMIFVSMVLLVFVTLAFVQQTAEKKLQQEHQSIVSDIKGILLAKYDEGGTKSLAEHIERLIATRSRDQTIFLLTDPQGRPIAGNIAEWPKGLSAPTDWAEVPMVKVWNVTEQSVGVSTVRLRGGERLLVGHILEAKRLAQGSMREGLTLAFPASLVLAVLITIITVATIARKVDAVVAVTEAVRGGENGPRVPISGGGDVFDRLAFHINAMLDQQERLVGQLRVMTDGLAHDLRSPLTRLRSTIDRALVELDDAVAIAALEKVATEADALLLMLSTALQISRAEAGIGRENFTRTDLGGLLLEMADVYGPICEDRGIAISVVSDADRAVPVHRQLLSQAIANLIDNALKYAEGATKLRLSVESAGREIAVVVADNGKGIPDEQREQALRRFGRLDPERGMAGAGLGLSLAQAVAQLHDGRIELSDNHPGLRVSLILLVDPE